VLFMLFPAHVSRVSKLGAKSNYFLQLYWNVISSGNHYKFYGPGSGKNSRIWL
jgi:hypothetical protein